MPDKFDLEAIQARCDEIERVPYSQWVSSCRADIPALVEEVKRLRSMIRAEHMPEGYDVPDDATTELAVQCASLEAHLSHWTSIANTARAEADSLRARAKELEEKLRGEEAFHRSVDEALNSGDGSYRP